MIQVSLAALPGCLKMVLGTVIVSGAKDPGMHFQRNARMLRSA
jgi:hypothetical protein